MAEDSTRAVDYLLKAAEHAFSVYAFVDATEYMEKALDLLIGDEDRQRRAQLLLSLASGVYIYTGQPDKAVEAGIASFTLWRDLGDPVKEADALLWVAFAFRWQGRESSSLSYIKRAVDILQEHPEEKGLLAKAYVQWATVASFMGDTAVALEKLRLADELHEQIGGKDPFVSVVSLWARSWCAFLMESPLRMLEYAQRGAEVCRTLRMFGWEPILLYSVAWAQMLLGRLVEGAQTANDALKKAQRHNSVVAQGWAHLARAFLAIQEADWDGAREFGDKAFAIAQQLHNFDLQSRVLWSRSVCAGWRGEWEEAIRNILEALPMARQEGETSLVYPYLLLQAAKSHFHAGKPEEAQYYLDQAMDLAQERHYGQLPAIGHRIQGRILQAQGRFDEAQSYLERSLAELAALEDVVEHTRTLEAYGLFFLARNREGDCEHGRALLACARETFDRLGVNG
jgi:tetratricopeptide (TPR) repeat protein